MNKTIRIIIILVLVAGAAFYGWKLKSEMRPKDALKVGVLAPADSKIKNGLELAKEDIEKNYQSFRVEIVYENCPPSGDLPQGHKTADLKETLKKLIEDEKAAIVSAYSCEPGKEPSLPVAETPGLTAWITVPPEPSEQMKNFQEHYKQKFGENPDAASASAYDTLFLQALAYRQCQGKYDCVNRELQAVKDYFGASGSFSIVPESQAGKFLVFKLIRKPKYAQPGK